jgi:hypothetical protein
MRTLITCATAALALFAAAPVSEAGHSHRHRSHVDVSGYRSCGTPVYTERYCVGYQRCGTPIWRYRVVSAPRRSYCPPPPCRPVVRVCPPPPCRSGVVFQGTFRW